MSAERIGLIDIDGHNFPNLCLMKISAWLKSRGNEIHLLKPDDILNGENLFMKFDKFYAACIFKENNHIAEKLQKMGVFVGGSGSDNKGNLHHYIEHMRPDYSLYGINNMAYGFLTRGCPRGCPFCIVGDKEGRTSRKVANLKEFWSGQPYIKLLDPNLLACDQHLDLLQQLIDSGAWIDFTQGLDARKLTPQNIDLINQLKIKMLHFAWDNHKDDSVKAALLNFRKVSKVNDFRKLKVYVLCNYWSTPEDDLYRVYWLRDNGYDPYVMIYDKPHAPKETRYLQRWVNNKRIFRTITDFKDYDHRVG